MSDVISAPEDWIESISELQFPESTDARLQTLMDRNNDGELTAEELKELTALVDLSEQISLVRAEAFHLLQRNPG